MPALRRAHLGERTVGCVVAARTGPRQGIQSGQVVEPILCWRGISINGD